MRQPPRRSHASRIRRGVAGGRVAPGSFTPRRSQVGSRAGARTLGAGGDSIAFARDRSPAAKIEQVLPASLICAETPLKLQKRSWIILFHGPEHYRLGLPESNGYPVLPDCPQFARNLLERAET